MLLEVTRRKTLNSDVIINRGPLIAYIIMVSTCFYAIFLETLDRGWWLPARTACVRSDLQNEAVEFQQNWTEFRLSRTPPQAGILGCAAGIPSYKHGYEP